METNIDDKEIQKELKELILKEIKLREEFRIQRAKLEALVDPLTKHNTYCVQFWTRNFPRIEELGVIMDNGTSFKLKRPVKEVASVESHLPFGIDFHEIKIINLDSQ